ncbi:MAG: TonB-dependent receptor domain-containing protein, partial [Endomicrobiia bacterium]
EEKTIFTNIFFDKNKFSSETSFRINYFSRYGYLPQFGQKFVFKPKFNIETFANISKIYRVPSYTELFYWDPNHQSSEDLKIEQTINYSLGAGFKINQNIGFSLAGSYCEPINAIDWARESGTSRWKVTNIAKVETYVLDFRFNFNYKFINSKLMYTFVNKKFDLPQNIELKYINNYPTNSLSFLLFLPPVIGFETSINNIYKKYTKTQPEEFFITNFTISKKIFKNTEVILNIENLFDNKYEEIPGIQQSPQRILLKLYTTF